MSESRIPLPPLPRPFYRIIVEDPVTREDLDNVKKTMQQSIDTLTGELRRERDLIKKLEKSADVLQEILSAPDFRALSQQMQSSATVAVASASAGQSVKIDEPPVEYVEVKEIELTDAEVVQLEVSEKK